MGNTHGPIGNLSIGAAYTRAELQALRSACEDLADAGRAVAGLVATGLIEGAAWLQHRGSAYRPAHG